MPRRAQPPELAEGVLLPRDGARTEKQQAFVDAYASNGGDGTQAAIAAGYAEAHAAQASRRLLANPLIQQDILKATLTRIGLHAPRALQTVVDLQQSARSDYVRLQAAQDLLDRAGFRPPDRVDARVDANLTVSFDIAPPPKVIEG